MSSSSITRLREQNRGQIARWLILLLGVGTVLALVCIQSDPVTSYLPDLFRALVGLAGLAAWCYFGHQRARKRRASVRELRVEARLCIQQRDANRKP